MTAHAHQLQWKPQRVLMLELTVKFVIDFQVSYPQSDLVIETDKEDEVMG